MVQAAVMPSANPAAKTPVVAIQVVVTLVNPAVETLVVEIQAAAMPVVNPAVETLVVEIQAAAMPVVNQVAETLVEEIQVAAMPVVNQVVQVLEPVVARELEPGQVLEWEQELVQAPGAVQARDLGMGWEVNLRLNQADDQVSAGG